MEGFWVPWLVAIGLLEPYGMSSSKWLSIKQ